MIAHNVFFTLHDNSEAAVHAMIDDCHADISPLPGIVFFAAGTAADSNGGYDVALHVVFKDRKAFDTYLSATKHVEFMRKYGDNWKDVLAYDSEVSSGRK
jgi:hypothetical protein